MGNRCTEMGKTACTKVSKTVCTKVAQTRCTKLKKTLCTKEAQTDVQIDQKTDVPKCGFTVNQSTETGLGGPGFGTSNSGPGHFPKWESYQKKA